MIIASMLGAYTASAVSISSTVAIPHSLKNATLVTSNGGSCLRTIYPLGDITLGNGQSTFSPTIAPTRKTSRWWLLGESPDGITFSSSQTMLGTDFRNTSVVGGASAQNEWPADRLTKELLDFRDRNILFSFGVMADTHYYSDPLGQPHPIEIEDPTFDLSENLQKMDDALGYFQARGASFTTILGDMVEEHFSYPQGSEPSTRVWNGALEKNTADIQSVFDKYVMPVKPVMGNHDNAGTSRSDLYRTMPFYSKEAYDQNDWANRFDYTFDIGKVRFIVVDNVNGLKGGYQNGFRRASAATLNFLENELAKLQAGGIDHDMHGIVMMHARVDCLPQNDCQQKIDLNDSTQFRWTRSLGGVNEYYLEAAQGGDPRLDILGGGASAHNQFLWIRNEAAWRGFPGNLGGSSLWGYGRSGADSLSFDTVYVRISELTNPVSHPSDLGAGGIHYKYISAGASENFEEQQPIYENAVANGAKILGVLQGHNHINDYNKVNGVEYYSFRSMKRAPNAYALVKVMQDYRLEIEGFFEQSSYNVGMQPEEYDCLSPVPEKFSLIGHIIDHNHVHESEEHSPATLWEFGPEATQTGTAEVDIFNLEVNYEDAEDGTTLGWAVSDNDPPGASISNRYDAISASQVIAVQGDKQRNSYKLRSTNNSDWNNSTHALASWSMNFAENYNIIFELETTEGLRRLRYTASDTDALGASTNIYIGLGADTKTGTWDHIERDLKADLALAQPTAKLLAVHSLTVLGSGMIDNIYLRKNPPIFEPDTDLDDLTDQQEQMIFGSSPFQPDTDHDGLGDAQEVKYWMNELYSDNDNDGLSTILDPDSDNDGYFDGEEVLAGSSPADSTSTPDSTVYENGEDGTSHRWEVHDNVPPGATVTNVFDSDAGSRVIQTQGSARQNGYRLTDEQGLSWSNETQFALSWKINSTQLFTIFVDLTTSAGKRRLRYNPVDSSTLGASTVVSYGIGSALRDGQWHTVSRDLKMDLAAAQPQVNVISVEHFSVLGNVMIDDIALRASSRTDTDGDGIVDEEEMHIYGSSPNAADSDNDGIDDRDELLYWKSEWENDADLDGIINLIDPDADNDGLLDGWEIAHNTDPGVFSERPTMPGDVNGDGHISISDLLLMQRYILDQITLDNPAIARGDVYPAGGDGKITISDALLVQKMLLTE